MLLAALQRQLARMATPTTPSAGGGPLEDRAAAYVERRLRLLYHQRPTAFLVGATPPRYPACGQRGASNVRCPSPLFAPVHSQLDRRAPSHGEQVALVVHVLCQVESIDALLGDHGCFEEVARWFLSGGLPPFCARADRSRAQTQSSETPRPRPDAVA